MKRLIHINAQSEASMAVKKTGELIPLCHPLRLIYDMCKAVDKRMRITNIRLISKTKRAS